MLYSFVSLFLLFTITVDSSQHVNCQSTGHTVSPNLKKHETHQNFPRNCKDVQNQGHNITDVYVIKPTFAPKPFLVLCDMETRGGGWTNLLSRYDGYQDFYLNWKNYKHGFGNLVGEFWLGLEKIHHLTGYEVNELLVELVDWDRNESYALYNSFGIGSEEEDYSLNLIDGYSGTGGDSLSYHRGMKFGTNDKDNDILRGDFCGRNSTGAWWYRDCKESQLTGKYLGRNVTEKNYHQGVLWNAFRGEKYSLAEARMMVRPRNHNNPVSLPYKR